MTRVSITRKINVRAAGTLPTWLASAAINEWVAVPNGTPSLAAGLVPAVAGWMGSQKNMVEAYCGAFTDGSRFMIHGGGHADYGGNEIGAIDLTSESPEWDLLIERTQVADLLGGSNYYADGRPTSRHTYYGMWYVPSLNKMLRFNANMGLAYNGTPVGGSADVRTVDIDAFNLATNLWEPAAYGPMPMITGSETTMAQDPTSGDVYAWDGPGGNRIYKWTAATDSAELVIDLVGTEGGGGAAVFDSNNQRMVRFFGREAPGVVYWDVVAGTKVTPTLTGPGAGALLSLGAGASIGIAHDTLRNVAYVSDGVDLFRVQLDDFYTMVVSPTGATSVTANNGTWGKLKYIESIDAIAYLSNWANSLLVMRVA